MKKNYPTLIIPHFLLKNKLRRFGFGFAVLMFFTAFKGLAQTTYTWNQAGAASWAVAANWTPNRTTPAANDVLVFNNGVITTPTNIPTETIGQLLVSATTTVNLQGAAALTVLTVSGGTGDDLTVATGSALNINVATNTTTLLVGAGATGVITGNMTFSTAAHRFNATDAGGITFNSPAVVTQDAGCTGNLFTNAGTANAAIFNTGTTLIQNTGANPFGLTAPASKVTFNTGSLLRFQQNAAPSLSGRTFANLEFNFATFNQSPTGTGLLTVDNLTITLGILNLNLTTAGVNIKGNISVAAGQTLTFSPAAASTLVLNGTTAQSITNAGTLTFAANESVTFNNAAGFTLNSNITLNNLVTFTSGVVTAANPTTLTLSSTASVAGVSNTSYVNGLVRKVGGTAFVFPVGKPGIGYVPIGISAPPVATDDFTAEYVRLSAEALGTISAIGLDHVSRVDYWTLNRTGTSTVDVTLNWTAESSNNGSASYINNMADLVVAHHNVTWDAFGGLGMTTGTVTAGSIVWPGVTLFSPFSLGSINFNNPLPVTFNYLNGTKQNSGNYLNWKVTCTNNPNVTMSLERSADKINFTSITSITADALRCQQPFDYTDNSPAAGLNYYRLKMTDANGKTTYSGAIAILNKAIGFDFVSLMPSVVNSTAVLNITSAQKIKMDVVITDIAGKQVQKIAYNLIAGSNQFKLNLANLGAGTYQITGYTADGEPKTLRFVKQ